MDGIDMREIKFRGKSLKTGEWVYGNLIQMSSQGSQIYICSFNEGASSMSCKELVAYLMVGVDPKTVGQYTGLKDRYGSEIYEGDILQLYKNRSLIEKFKVVWNENGYWDCCVWFKNSEIIGNIFDNPEILASST